MAPPRLTSTESDKLTFETNIESSVIVRHNASVGANGCSHDFRRFYRDNGWERPAGFDIQGYKDIRKSLPERETNPNLTREITASCIMLLLHSMLA